MRIFDTFMFGRELDILECRLTELQDIPNLLHVLVEAHVDHQDHPKPLFYADNRERFSAWSERIVHVIAARLPTHAEDSDPWARELAQREWVANGLAKANAQPEDVVFHGDCDEIPSVVAARNLRPSGFVSLEQRLCCFAVDWLHPDPWYGTVAARLGTLQRIASMNAKAQVFGAMRGARNTAPKLPNAGWHLSWLGTTEENLAKLNSFCHPEVADRVHDGLMGGGNRFIDEGFHVDGKKLLPADVDRSWPRWVRERRCPASWFRQR